MNYFCRINVPIKNFLVPNSFSARVCMNDAGYRCDFPFEYKGKWYHDCAPHWYYNERWCYDVRGNGNWGYCKLKNRKAICGKDMS